MNLNNLTIIELLTLRDQIMDLLPQAADLDLNRELVFQFLIAKNLMTEVQNDGDTPANQKAQVLNSTAALLKQLSDAQVKMYSADRLRVLENTLIDTLKTLDPAIYEQFNAEYTSRLEAIS